MTPGSAKLRQIEMVMGLGETITLACERAGSTAMTQVMLPNDEIADEGQGYEYQGCNDDPRPRHPSPPRPSIQSCQ